MFSARELLALGKDRELVFARLRNAVSPVDQRLELAHPLAKSRPQLFVDLGGQSVEDGERAAQRKQDQRQVAWRRRVGRFEQRIVDGRDLLLRFLLRDVGRDRLARSAVAARAASGARDASELMARHCGSLEFITRMPAATRRWLAFVVVERRRSSSSLRATTSSRAATRSSRAFRLRLRHDHRRFDFVERRVLKVVPFSAASSS